MSSKKVNDGLMQNFKQKRRISGQIKISTKSFNLRLEIKFRVKLKFQVLISQLTSKSKISSRNYDASVKLVFVVYGAV